MRAASSLGSVQSNILVLKATRIRDRSRVETARAVSDRFPWTPARAPTCEIVACLLLAAGGLVTATGPAFFFFFPLSLPHISLQSPRAARPESGGVVAAHSEAFWNFSTRMLPRCCPDATLLSLFALMLPAAGMLNERSRHSLPLLDFSPLSFFFC